MQLQEVKGGVSKLKTFQQNFIVLGRFGQK
jgi:hypothetical protein